MVTFLLAVIAVLLFIVVLKFVPEAAPIMGGIAVGAFLIWLILSFWWVPIALLQLAFDNEIVQSIVGLLVLVLIFSGIAGVLTFVGTKYIDPFTKKHKTLGAFVSWVQNRWYARALFYLCLILGVGVGIPFILYLFGAFQG